MKSDRYLGCGACSVVIIMFILISFVNGYFIQYGLNRWAMYFGKGIVGYWPCVAIAVIPVIGQLAIPFAAITFILMLVL